VKAIAGLGDSSLALLVPNGPELWYSVRPSATRPAALFHVATGGGAPVSEGSLGTIGVAFSVSQEKLAFVRTTVTSPSSWLESLVVRDRTSGAETVVTPASEDNIFAIAGTQAGLFFVSGERSTSTGRVTHFDGTRTQSLVSLRTPLRFATDGTEVFFLEYGRSWELRAATTTAGAVSRSLRTFGAKVGEVYRLIGIQGDEVFVAHTNPIGHGTFNDGEVIAVRKDGSSSRVVVTVPGFTGDAIVDADYVTWVDGIAGKSIVRARITTGVTERFDAPGMVGELAADTCNLYFSTQSPDVIYARSRLP